MLTLIFLIVVVPITGLIFFEVNRDLWDEIGSELFSSTKKKVKKTISNTKEKSDAWYRKTRLFMWNNNRKNKVKILSEEEYLRLLKEGKIKYVIIEE